MFSHWQCIVRVGFDDEDVRDWLDVGEDYQVTYEDRKNYAWYLIENDDGEYGSVCPSEWQ